MKKIPTLFQRNYETDRFVRNEVVPGCEWVLNGEGTASEKIDGTSCLVKDGDLYKRYELKQGRTAPEGFLPAQDPDPVTGDVPGWVLVQDTPADRWHIAAYTKALTLPDGTYELVGEKVQDNPHKVVGHELWPHGERQLEDVPRDFDGLRDYLREHYMEGIVWNHPDGRMCKLKRRDFGFSWPVR